jgi:hypothetical protein
MMRRIPLRLFVMASWIGLAPELSAQGVSGRVSSTDGQPIADAVVAIWDSISERARSETSPTGYFSLAMPEGAIPVTITARSIGYQPSSQPLDAGRLTGVVIALTPYAVPLPDLTTYADRLSCPNKEEPAARELWDAMRRRYAVAPANRGGGAVLRWSRDVVPKADVGSLDDNRLVPALQGEAGELRQLSEQFMMDSGYAASLKREGSLLVQVAQTNDLYADWWYPSLDRWDIDHWLRDSFGHQHTLSARAHEDGSVEILFCDTGKTSTGVEGSLSIGSDTTLIRAAWHFHTPKPDEKAGGQVVFVPAGTGRVRRLVPMSSVFWRQVGGRKDLYVQDAATYQAWGYGPSGAIPSCKTLGPDACP